MGEQDLYELGPRAYWAMFVENTGGHRVRQWQITLRCVVG